MSLREAFDESVIAATAATDDGQVDAVRDSALIEAGRTLADQIDWATEHGEGQEITKALYLVPHLMNVLREMYVTPKARLDAGIKGDASGGEDSKSKVKVGKFRAVAGGKSA